MSYGGNQGWFYDPSQPILQQGSDIIEGYGCGTISASDILLYLSKIDPKYKTTITDFKKLNSSGNINYDSYKGYVYFIDNVYVTAVRWLGALGPFVAKGVNSYSKTYKLGLKATWSVKKEKILPTMIEMLKDDIPVMLSIGPAGERNIVNFYKSDEGFSLPYQYGDGAKTNGHYVTVTGVIKNKIEDSIMLRISSWGREYYINYDEYYDFLTNISNDYFTSILKITR